MNNLKIKLFADGADLQSMVKLSQNPKIKGFTTNPTLMYKAGVKDYRTFAKDLLKIITDKPISFEVFADKFDEMAIQAKEIASWGSNVYVKIPITNTYGESSTKLIEQLSHSNIKINVTGIFTVNQIIETNYALKNGAPSIISVFAGRIADTGVNPVPIMEIALSIIDNEPNIELLWASSRELYNIIEANKIGCHIITVTPDILTKLNLIGKNLKEFSLETVKMFYDDAKKSNYSL